MAQPTIIILSDKDHLKLPATVQALKINLIFNRFKRTLFFYHRLTSLYCALRAPGEEDIYAGVEDSQEVCATSFSTSPPSQVDYLKRI